MKKAVPVKDSLFDFRVDCKGKNGRNFVCIVGTPYMASEFIKTGRGIF